MTWEEMYAAVLANDARYDTVFFYAVKSTGIYCRPSCKSRAPKRENILFFPTAAQACKAGFRACKRCRSDLVAYAPAKDVAQKIRKFLDDTSLETAHVYANMENMGLSRKRLIEIFKDVYGITPQAYRNNLRFQEAQKLLEQTNKDIIDIAFSVGFNSLSAFYAFFKRRASVSPAAYRLEKNT